MNRPKIIAITPIRNEAWVLDAYLACTSSWADFIILADQHSTDGSIEIAIKYPKVILINNPLEEMNQAEARRLLFREVDKIEGDKIVFAIDADEFLSAGFWQTETWKLILESKPNSIFCFKWLNMYQDFSHALPLSASRYMDWVCHLDVSLSLEEEYYKREKNAVHECRIPCLSDEECKYYMVDDITFVHLARINLARTKNKEDFYQVSTIDKRNQPYSAVSLYRTYHYNYQIDTLTRPIKLLSSSGEDFSYKVRFGDVGDYYIREIISVLKRRTEKPFEKIDIWNNPYLIKYGVNHKQPFTMKVLFFYLRKTTKFSKSIFVRGIDTMLKKIV